MLPPPYIVRLVLIYGRSQCVPQVSPEGKKVVCYLLTQVLNRLVVDYPTSRDLMLFPGECECLFFPTCQVAKEDKRSFTRRVFVNFLLVLH